MTPCAYCSGTWGPTARTFGIPQRFLAHGSRDEVLAEIGLVPQHLARQITEAVAQLDPELADNPQG